MITETTLEGAGLAKIEIDTDGMFTKHNYPCPICQNAHAVLRTNVGTFEPCWDCQKQGHRTIKFDLKSWWQRLLLWIIK